jgi:carotenoid cleavage dioxygenase-like enzyme
VRPGAAEADGYLLALVNRFASNQSDLAVLHARRIADGPVALLRLPVRVRSTFHGMWVPESAATSGRYTA